MEGDTDPSLIDQAAGVPGAVINLADEAHMAASQAYEDARSRVVSSHVTVAHRVDL